VLSEEKRRRTIEILKFRGSAHEKGESLFTIHPEQAIVIIPLSAIAIPTLIRRWPLPVTRIIGALTVKSRVLVGLVASCLDHHNPVSRVSGVNTAVLYSPSV